MNLSEEKKEPLRQQPLMNKRKMLIMHYKGVIHVSYLLSGRVDNGEQINLLIFTLVFFSLCVYAG